MKISTLSIFIFSIAMFACKPSKHAEFKLHYHYSGLGSQMGALGPHLVINGNNFTYMYKQNSFYGEPNLDSEILKTGKISDGAIDSILTITKVLGDTLIYEINHRSRSGGIHFMNVYNHTDTTRFKLWNTSHTSFVKVIKVLNPYLPKDKK
ncbi:MAG: hypothetical protein ACPGLV_18695, partial [Bacteroidia bacterium]